MVRNYDGGSPSVKSEPLRDSPRTGAHTIRDSCLDVLQQRIARLRAIHIARDRAFRTMESYECAEAIFSDFV